MRLNRGAGLLRIGRDDAHKHHEERHVIPGPAAQPANPPLAEARVDRDWSLQAQESGFEAHACDIHARQRRRVKASGRTTTWQVTSPTGHVTVGSSGETESAGRLAGLKTISLVK